MWRQQQLTRDTHSSELQLGQQRLRLLPVSLPHTRKMRALGVHSGRCSNFSSAAHHSVGTAFLKAYQATSLVAARGWFMPVATLESSGESFLNIDHPQIPS